MLTGWKTVIVGALVTLFGFAQGLDWIHLLPNNPTLVGWIVSGLGVVMVILRGLTSTPIGKSS